MPNGSKASGSQLSSKPMPDAMTIPAHIDIVIQDFQGVAIMRVFDEKDQPLPNKTFAFKFGSKAVTSNNEGRLRAVSLEDLKEGISGLADIDKKEEPLPIPKGETENERRKQYLMRKKLVAEKGWGIAEGPEVERLQRALNELIRRDKLRPKLEEGAKGVVAEGGKLLLKEDGIFGEQTEIAVVEFQKQFKDWDEENIKPADQLDPSIPRLDLLVDGRVGERTADAINRTLVGILYSAYINYRKNKKGELVGLLTLDGKPGKNTAKPELKEDAKILIQVIGKIPEVALEAILTMRLIDVFEKPLQNLKYRLKVADQQFEGVTNDKGLLSHNIPRDATDGELMLDNWSVKLHIKKLDPADTVAGAISRLDNLGYFASEEGSNKELSEQMQLALMRFQSSHDLEASGKLDDATKKKLEDVHDA